MTVIAFLQVIGLGTHIRAAMDLSEVSDASVVGICSEDGHNEELVRE